MADKEIQIPGKLTSIAAERRVADASQIWDGEYQMDQETGADQSTINNRVKRHISEHAEAISEISSALDRLNGDEETEGSVQYQVKAERTRAAAAEAELQGMYERINANDIIVGARPSSGQEERKIYRVPGGENEAKYTDWMWYGGEWVQMATFTISNEPLLVGLYTCDTGAGTAAKTVAATGFQIPASGGAIKIKMENANTANNATLNINSTGAKPLFYDGERASSTNSWEKGEIVEVYYDPAGNNNSGAYYANNVAGGGSISTLQAIASDIIELEEAISYLVSATKYGNQNYSWVIITTSCLLKVTGISANEKALLRSGEATGPLIRTSKLYKEGDAYYLTITDSDLAGGKVYVLFNKNDNLEVQRYVRSEKYLGFIAELPDNAVPGMWGIANVEGNYGNIVVNKGETAILSYDGSAWSKVVIAYKDVFTFDVPGGYGNATTGGFSPSIAAISTDFIKVSAGDIVYYTGYDGAGGAVVAFNGYRQYVSTLLGGTNTKYYRHAVVIPAGVEYIRASAKDSTNANYVEPELLVVSRNLSLSDLAATVATIKRNIGWATNEDFAITGQNLNHNGTAKSASAYVMTDFIPVKEGDIVTYSGENATGNAAVCTYTNNSESAFEAEPIAGKPVLDNEVIVVPEGVNYIRACAKSEPTHSLTVFRMNVKDLIDNLQTAITQIESDIADIREQLVFTQEIIEDKPYNDGGRIKQKIDGTTEGNQAFEITSFIPVVAGDIVVCTGGGNTTTGLLCGFSADNEGAFVEMYLRGTAAQVTAAEITIPEGVTFIRFCSQTIYERALQIKHIEALDIPEALESLQDEIDTAKGDIADLQAKDPISFAGKRIAVLGDSISTGTGLNPNLTVLQSDVDNNRQLTGWVTWYDVFTVTSGLKSESDRTYGDIVLTGEHVGTQVTFIPQAADVGKKLGKAPSLYSDQNGWAYKVCEKLGATLINASWSGASMNSSQRTIVHEYDQDLCSYAWHDCTIGRCKTRDENGNDIIPDVIIIYRGTNDFSHSPYAYLDSDYDLYANGYPDTDLYDTNKYGYFRAYYLTIKKLRAAYPNAMIYCCTLNVFLRSTADRFPVRNTSRGYSLFDFNNAIRQIANTMGCGLIEFDKDGITFENCATYLRDDLTHPNPTGQAVMANRALVDMKYLIQTP